MVNQTSRRSQIEAMWSSEEWAFARLWDSMKPASAPLWWCLDDDLKVQFRVAALGVVERLIPKLEEWLAEARSG